MNDIDVINKSFLISEKYFSEIFRKLKISAILKIIIVINITGLFYYFEISFSFVFILFVFYLFSILEKIIKNRVFNDVVFKNAKEFDFIKYKSHKNINYLNLYYTYYSKNFPQNYVFYKLDGFIKYFEINRFLNFILSIYSIRIPFNVVFLNSFQAIYCIDIDIKNYVIFQNLEDGEFYLTMRKTKFPFSIQKEFMEHLYVNQIKPCFTHKTQDEKLEDIQEIHVDINKAQEHMSNKIASDREQEIYEKISQFPNKTDNVNKKSKI